MKRRVDRCYTCGEKTEQWWLGDDKWQCIICHEVQDDNEFLKKQKFDEFIGGYDEQKEQ